MTTRDTAAEAVSKVIERMWATPCESFSARQWAEEMESIWMAGGPPWLIPLRDHLIRTGKRNEGLERQLKETRAKLRVYMDTLEDAGYAFEGEYPKPPLDKFSGDESGPHKGPWIVCEHADIIGCRETDNVATIASNHADPWFSSVYGDSSGWDGMVECVRIALGELLMRLRALIKNDTGEGRRSFIEWVESHMGQGLSGDDGWRLGQ